MYALCVFIHAIEGHYRIFYSLGADQVGPLEVGVRQGADIHVHQAHVVVFWEQVGQSQ